MKSSSAVQKKTHAPDRLTESIVDKLNDLASSSDFDFHTGLNQVLADVGMSTADCGGQLTFYGKDTIVPPLSHRSSNQGCDGWTLCN